MQFAEVKCVVPWGVFLVCCGLSLSPPVALAAVAYPTSCIDQDGDGYGSGCALGPDCNDSNPNIHPGARDVCGNQLDEDCNGNADNLVLDSAGRHYCFQVDPITAVVSSPADITLRAYHEDGIDRLEFVRDGDFVHKTTKPCQAAQSCVLTTTATQDFEGSAYFSFFFWKVPGSYVTEINMPVLFACSTEYCPPDPDLNIFFSWMRARGYAECVTSQYFTSSLDPLSTPVIKASLAARTSLFSSPFTVHFYDIVPTDAGATYRALGTGEGGNCSYQSAWPSWCPTPVPADYDFVRRHFERTFGVAFSFVYHRMPVGYASTFGTPQLINGSYYRFPNSRNTFVSQFPAQAIIHYAIQTYNGLPIQDMTGAVGTRAEVSLEPYDGIIGISAYTHEWGHTWGLVHSFYGTPRVFTGLDGIMDNSYRGITPLVDSLDPVERYVLQPGSGYLDQLTFASTYTNGILGSWQLPSCGTVDPAIVSAQVLTETSDTVTIRLTLANNGTLPTGFLTLAAFNGTETGPLLESRTLWKMLPLAPLAHDFSLNKASITSGTVTFVIDSDNSIISEAEDNNRHSVTLGSIQDCNGNGIPDNQDIGNYTSYDCNINGAPDECESSFAMQVPSTPLSGRFSVATNPSSYLQTITALPRTRKLLIEPMAMRSQRLVRADETTFLTSATAEMSATVRVLASEITYGPSGPDVPVRLDYQLQDGTFTPLFGGQNVQVGSLDTLSIGSVATNVIFRGKSAYPNFTSPSFQFTANSTSLNVITFLTGNNFDQIITMRGVTQPFGGQMKIACAVAPFVDITTHNITLPPGSMLMLFELGTTNRSSAAYDFQDLVILVSPN